MGRVSLAQPALQLQPHIRPQPPSLHGLCWRHCQRRLLPFFQPVAMNWRFSALDNVAYEELIPISPYLRGGAAALVCFAAIADTDAPTLDFRIRPQADVLSALKLCSSSLRVLGKRVLTCIRSHNSRSEADFEYGISRSAPTH